MQALQTNIYLTDVCNKNCPHCYYPKNSTSMAYDMTVHISHWIGGLCRLENVEQYKAHFLGGEPLRHFACLLRLVDQLEVSLPFSTKGHSDGKYVVFTNGDLLTKAKLEELKKRKIMVMLNPTTDTIKKVEEKVAMIKLYCGGVSLAVVADENNLYRLVDLTRLALDYGGHVRINRLYHGGTIPGYVESFKEEMHKVFDILLKADKPMWPNFILESTYPLWEGPKNCHACGRWLLVIDPDGSIRSCNGDVNTKIGHIYTHTRMRDFTFPHRWSSKDLEECKGCEWANGGWCQGGCPFTRKLAFGTYNKKSPFCSAYKELFPRLQELKKRWIESNGNRLDS